MSNHSTDGHKVLAKILISAAIVFIVLMIIFLSSGNKVPETDFAVIKGSFPDIATQNIEILYSDSAKLKMKLNAPEAEKFSDEREPFTRLPKGVHILFYDNNKQVTSSLRADYAKYYENRKIWEFRSKVLLINQQNDTLKTEQLLIDTDKEKMYSKQFVSINFGDGGYMGSDGGFRANMDFIDYEFTDISKDLSFWGEDSIPKN